jgi:hypothetical protein
VLPENLQADKTLCLSRRADNMRTFIKYNEPPADTNARTSLKMFCPKQRQIGSEKYRTEQEEQLS